MKKTPEKRWWTVLPAWRELLGLMQYHGCIRTGYKDEFTLASGRKSHYLVDAKQVMFRPQALWRIGELIHAATTDLPPWDAIGGLELGAVPLTAAALGNPNAGHKHGFVVRKEKKDHGTKAKVDGGPAPGAGYVVVEDVLTTGGSALQAIAAVTANGGYVVGVVCLVDRLETRDPKLKKYPVRAIFDVKDFGITPDRR